MDTTNIILFISGIIVTFFGIAAFLNPNFTRWINAPGGLRLKAIIAPITGIILVIISFTTEIPTN